MTGAPTPLPDDLQVLIRDRVESYEQLHVLLLLHGSPGRSWTADMVAEALHLPADDANEALSALCASGLLSASSTEYEIQSGTHRDTIAHLARAFEQQPLAVMSFLSANAVDRIRTGAIRAFANAFIIKRGKKDG